MGSETPRRRRTAPGLRGDGSNGVSRHLLSPRPAPCIATQQCILDHVPALAAGRGPAGVRQVISDAHSGLKAAIARVFQGAAWQRCKVHLMRNLLASVPRASSEMVAATVRTIFAQPDAASTRAHLRVVVDTLRERFPAAALILEEAEADVTAYADFPRAHAKKIASTNPLERVHKEIKRRTNVVGIFPDDKAVIRLVGAILVEVHDEWQTTDRRYLSEASMALIDAPGADSVHAGEQHALPAA